MISTSPLHTSHSPVHCKPLLTPLFHPLTNVLSDPNERAHFWLPDSTLTGASALLDTPVAERMYIDQGEVLRVRVEADEFCDDEPGPPRAAEGVSTRREPTRPPYIVCVRFFVDGYGLAY